MPVIAVDGPAASGKGTLGRKLAEQYGFAHLDTGLLYRAVGFRVPDGDPAVAITAARAFDPGWLGAPQLRDEAVGGLASKISGIAEVRAALLAFQRSFAGRAPGAVLDGRDIGTVICPAADAKLFVTAEVEVRAARRLKELRGRGVAAIFAEVLQDLIERDARDSRRAAAPLAAAEDAFILDTTHLDADQAFAAAVDHVRTRIKLGPQLP